MSLLEFNKRCSFKVKCLNDETFPQDCVNGFFPSDDDLKMTLLSATDGRTEKWIAKAMPGKKFDFEIESSHNSEIKLLVLNAHLTKKSFAFDACADVVGLPLAFGASSDASWYLEFDISYFGSDEVKHVLTIDGKNYESYSELTTEGDHEASYILKINEECVGWHRSVFTGDFRIKNLCSGKEFKLAAGKLLIISINENVLSIKSHKLEYDHSLELCS